MRATGVASRFERCVSHQATVLPQLSRLSSISRQASAGLIVGLSSVIYSLSYGALLFSGPLAEFVGYGITIALITAVFGALFGCLSEEKTFIGGPDANTVSVMASLLAVLGSMDLPGPQALKLAVGTIILTSALCAVAFYAAVKAKLSGLLRYIPYSVMAGLLASTGWLMASGALNIIAGTPLTLEGIAKLMDDPMRPQIAVALLVAAALAGLARWVSGAILIPLVMLVATVAVNLALNSSYCAEGACAPESWLFAKMQDLPWLAPWQLDWRIEDLDYFIEALPAMMVVSFVGLLTVLLSIASLEISYQKEFNLNRSLRTHAMLAGATAMFGGFVGIVAIGRTMLNHKAGGGAVAGVIASAMCLAMLLGAGGIISYLPKAALGGLILYLGYTMLKQWLWDQRRTTTPLEFGQIFLILGLVANYGFLLGFTAGTLIACIVFVVTYSRIPLADLATNLSLLTSSVVRPAQETETLRLHGERTLLYRLSGYVFFGSASKIDSVFRTLGAEIDGVVLDFTNVSGIDTSAIGVFQRILRRYRYKPTRFYFVYATGNETSLRAIATEAATSDRIHYFPDLDHALENAEEEILTKWGRSGGEATLFDFLEESERRRFLSYCELRQVHQGELLCAERDYSEEVFFIESGSLEVIKSIDGTGVLRLAKLQKGAMVGELAFYTGEARTASIAAVNESAVYVLHRKDLARMRVDCPEIAMRFDHMVIRKISGALARTNKLVTMFR